MALARVSLLASFPQNPVNFDPLLFAANVSGLLDRQDYVLQQMLQAHMQINLGLGSQTQNAGEITTEVVRQVEDLSQHMQFVGFHNELKAPHFVWWVIRTLANILGNNQQINPQTGLSSPGLHLLLSGGFNIRTTLDLNLETYVERAVQRHLNQPERQKLTGKFQTLSKDNNIHNASTIVMDAHSGEILAMDGSADWTDSDPRIGGQLNSALLAHQSASTFKPIIMAAAFELGWYPGIVLNDTLTYFPLGGVAQQGGLDSFHTYTPTDYGNTYSGQGVNLAFAMSNSLNVPSVKAYMFAGKQNVYSMARRLGITSITPGQINATSALGTAEVPLLQMVGAYQVFANAGRRALPQSILSISDNAGHLFYTYDVTHPAGGQAISPQIAYMVTSLLSDKQAHTYPFANDQDLSLHDWKLPDGTFPDVAVRTGTTDYFKDNWAIGYTPDLVAGVWEGNSNGAPAITDSLAPTVAVPLWHSVVEYASGHCNQTRDQIPCPPFDLRVPEYHFSVPAGLVRQEVNTFNGLAGTGYTSWMLKNERPVQTGW
ncbi:MAG TPA: penicillin-binding transpeptidase domain-containing protein [Ktedonobacteraceae bacterium]|nr:penicillin-binding transpeptidase domain-containing protein [Ktedonobacteraceae bacterium]